MATAGGKAMMAMRQPDTGVEPGAVSANLVGDFAATIAQFGETPSATMRQRVADTTKPGSGDPIKGRRQC